MNFQDLYFKNKILILLAIPLLGFIWSSISSISTSIKASSEMTQLTELTELSTVYSELVHELQKERGMTAGFLGSKGTKFGDKLKRQRQETNNKKSNKSSYWNKNEFPNKAILSLNNQIDQQLTQRVMFVKAYSNNY